MNNKKFSTLTIITCLTMLIASNLIAMDTEDTSANTAEKKQKTTEALVCCSICLDEDNQVSEPAPEQLTKVHEGKTYGCRQGTNPHYFHQNCLGNWLSRNPTCPQCKAELLPDPNKKDTEGNTALHRATSAGNQQVINFLLAIGADINMKNKYGETALYLATVKSNQAIVELLLANGANPNLQRRDGNTALHAGVNENHTIVELLLTHDADPNLQDCNKYTALHDAVKRGNQTITELLLRHGANPNLQTNKGSTALHYLAEKNFETLINICNRNSIEYDMNINWNEKVKAIGELLLANGANINLQNDNGHTPLHIAVAKNNRIIAELLLIKGANVSLINKKNQTALQIATKKGYQDIIDAINSPQSFLVYRQLQKQFPSTTITQENNSLTVNDITVKFSYDTDRYNPFDTTHRYNVFQTTDDNYHTIDIMVGDNTEPLKTYLTQALGATTHKLGMLGTCWHLGTSNWQLTYRDASSWYSNYSSHSHIKPNTPLRFYLSAPDDADFQNYTNFCVGLVAAAAGLTHE